MVTASGIDQNKPPEFLHRNKTMRMVPPQDTLRAITSLYSTCPSLNMTTAAMQPAAALPCATVAKASDTKPV